MIDSMDKKAEKSKERGSKKPKLQKIFLLFTLLAPWSLLLGPLFLFLFTAVLFGLVMKKGWSAVLILFTATLGVIMGISSKIYVPILPSVFLFWLGIIAYRQLREDTSGSQIKNKEYSGIKKIYPFLINAVQAFLIGAAFFILGYVFIARPFKTVDTSMQPTFKENSLSLYLTLPLRFINPGRQDIVVYRGSDPEKDAVARVIGIPGDKIALKDGYVYLNGKFLDEPYILRPRSTWVHKFAIFGKNCEEIIVPENNYFLIGDNRDVSGGSVYTGFTPKDSIIGYIPHSLIRFLNYYPFDLSNRLRDTSRDKDLMGKSIVDVNKYVEFINKKRVENGVRPLKYDNKLEQSADLRLKDMIKYNDFSYEATRSGYVAWEALSRVGYNDKTYLYLERIGEGYINSSSLFDLYWQNEDKENLLSKNLQYVGVVSKFIDINNCPKQIIVQHFLGQ